jgi:DNA adenine methylase
LSAATIGALAPWFGGKRTLAPTIVEELGQHNVYWEPFCGSMAVLFAKEPCAMETVNDLHGDLINLAHVVQREDTAIELYGRMARTLLHEELLSDAAARWRIRGNAAALEVPDLDRASDYMMCSWFGRNGVAGTQSYNQGFCVRYTANGGHSATRWRSAVESIPAWHERLRTVTILNRDAFALIAKIDDAHGTVIYCDPPYLVKGAKYTHDFKDDDHARLAKQLFRFRRARVVVSYYDDPRLNELYPGWRRSTTQVTKSLVQAGQRDKSGKATALEVLLCNGPLRGGAAKAPTLFGDDGDE